MQAKIFEAKECSCPKKCHLKFSHELSQTLFRNFYAWGSHTLQAAYIFGQVRVYEKQHSYIKQNIKSKENTRRYVLPDGNGNETQVCKKFFKQSLGVADGRITRILATRKSTGKPKSDQRGQSPSAK